MCFKSYIAKAGFVFLAAVAVSGCGDDQVASLKESVAPFYDNYTVGQIFDNRSICASTSWASFKGERDETVIEYKCDLKGVEEYERGLLSYHSENLYPILERQSSVEKRIKYLEQVIASDKRDIDSYQELLDNPVEGRESRDLLRRINEGEKYLNYLTSLSVNDVVKNDGMDINTIYLRGSQVGPTDAPGAAPTSGGDYLPPRDFYREVDSLVSKINSSSGAGAVFYDVSKEEAEENRKAARSKLDDVLANMRMRVERSIKSLKSSREKYLAGQREMAERNLERAIARIKESEPELKEAYENAEAYENDFVASLDNHISELESELENVYASEVFQWVVTPKGEYSLVYSGIVENSITSDERELDYRNNIYAVERVFEDELSDYEDLMKAIGVHQQKVYALSAIRTQFNRDY